MKKKSFLVYPYIIWSAIFIVIPLILVVLFSFTQKIDGKQVFSIANYKDLMDPIYKIYNFSRRLNINLFDCWIPCSIFNI